MANKSAVTVVAGQIGTATATDTIIGTVGYGAAQNLTAPQQAQAQSNLGLGSIATQAASAVAITGGTATLTQVIAAKSGGGTSSGFVTQSAGNPAYGWSVTGAATDSGVWDAIVVGSQLQFRMVNDAMTSAPTWLTVARSGVTITGITFGAIISSAAPAAGDNSSNVPTTSFLASYTLRGDLVQSWSATYRSQALANLGLNTAGPPAPNPIDNAEMRIAQRGTSFTNVASGATLPAMTLDRWLAYRTSFAANLGVSQVTGPTGYASALRIQRASGDTSTAALIIGEILETSECAQFAGQTVTLSATLKAGANFSAASGAVTLQISYGTGTDEGRSKLAAGTWAGAGSVSGTVTATTTATRLKATLAIPATATELAIIVSYVPAGTAGTADTLDVTGAQLEVGSVAGPFQRDPVREILARCQRHYRTSTVHYDGYAGAASTTFSGPEDFQVTMRVAPTLAQTNTAATNCSTTVGNNTLTVQGFNDTRSSTAAGAISWTTTYTATADL